MICHRPLNLILSIFILIYSSSSVFASYCCFESPITQIGLGQYWVNLSVVDTSSNQNNLSFSLTFGSIYRFPAPIALNENDMPASCRLLNPTDDSQRGSDWACIGKIANFRIDTSPNNRDPVINQLYTNSSGLCEGKSNCNDSNLSKNNQTTVATPSPDDKISLGLLGTYDKGPVIASFTVAACVLVGICLAIYFRNRKRKRITASESPGNNLSNRDFSLYHFLCGPCLPAKPKIRKSTDPVEKQEKAKKRARKEKLVQITPPLPGSKLLETAVPLRPKTSSIPLVSRSPKEKEDSSLVIAIPRKLKSNSGPNLLQQIVDKQKPKSQLVGIKPIVAKGNHMRVQKPKNDRVHVLSSAVSETGSDDIPIGLIYKK